ncbi:TIGR02186 family protein [Aminobacter sp. BE322]|uniref:TIGR02186 family protein n=1 Tax=unclassified Aminobacter TaxID=2644704 RepID=UPI003D190DDE
MKAAAATAALAATLAAILTTALPARAQEVPAENIQIGLSTDRVAITADFAGADLTIFGALENADPQVTRQGRYDVIVVLEGPARPVVVRRKDRILGMWINTRSETFVNVPVSYSMATTRPPQDVTTPNSYKQLSLGIPNIYLEPDDKRGNPVTIQEFTDALRERKEGLGLYSDNVGGVQFLSQNLFRATLHLAPNVPVGTHKARAFLFRNGLFVKETSTQLAIVKSGFEQTIYRFANDHGFGYGLFAIALAMFTGWLGRIIFRKD